jgi:predicted Zn-dependent peptidase
MYQLTRLPNGLTIASAEMPHMASVSLGLWVAVGSRYEPARTNGICHFIEHLLFKGTRRRSAREISQSVEGIGGYLNAFTSEEVTCFYSRARHDRLDVLLDVLMDMLLDSKFAPGDIAKERDVIKEEVSLYLDQPQLHVQELLNDTLWPDQPLGRPITGTNETLDAITRPDLVGYLRRNYAAGVTLIAAAGNVRHHDLLHAVAPYAARMRGGSRPIFAPARSEQQRPRIRLVTRQTEQTHLALGLRTCARTDSRRYALRLLNALLGENMSSRLFQILREDRGLAYSIYSTPSFFADAGDLVISAGLDTVNVFEALRLILRELSRLKNKAPGRQELKRARDFTVGQLELGLESTENQMNWLGEQWLAHNRISPPAEIKRQLRRVTAGDIRAVACDFFRPPNINLALVSPRKSARDLLRLLHL